LTKHVYLVITIFLCFCSCDAKRSTSAVQGNNVFPAKTYVYCNVSVDQGCFLTGSRIVVYVNSKPVVFFGEKFSKIPQFAGINQSIVNNWFVNGNNVLKMSDFPKYLSSLKMKSLLWRRSELFCELVSHNPYLIVKL
jgi:hypothetical protein